MKITSPQIKAIHALRRELPAMDEDAYRDFLESEAGVRSSKDLNEDQARRVIGILRRLAGGQTLKPKAQAPNPKGGLVCLALREAFSAGWDLPTVPGPFDNSVEAKRARVRARVLAWLQERYPHLHGTPKRLEAWPMEALQALVEHLKGLVGAKRRWQNRR